MKRILTIFLLILSAHCLSAQAPTRFNYQAVARNTSGNLIINQNISVRISILTGSPTGAIEYSETHSVTTDAFGVFNLLVGGGTIVSGSFDAITWGSASKFLKIEADVAGGTAYQTLATTQILSMPYALYANKAGNVFSGDYSDLINKPVISVSHDSVKLTGGSFGILPKTFKDNEFRIINISDVANNPTVAPLAALAGFGSGNVDNGTHEYKVTFITESGETVPGPASNIVTITDNSTDGQILLTSIPTAMDASVKGRRIYRRFNSSGDYYLVHTMNDNSTKTYIDNILNSSLGLAIPSSNSTESSVIIDASHLTDSRIITIPDMDGIIVLDTSNITINVKADKSLILNGRNSLMMFYNNNGKLSLFGKEWLDVYTTEGGKMGLTYADSSTSCFFENTELFYFPGSLNNENDPLINPSNFTNPELAFQHLPGYATLKYKSLGGTHYFGKTFDPKFIHCIDIQTWFYHQTDGPSNAGIYLEIFDGASWTEIATLDYKSTGSFETLILSYNNIYFVNNIIQGIRLRFYDSDPTSSNDNELRVYNLDYSSSTEPAIITHSIPSGTFSTNLKSVIGIPYIAKWEEGSNIRFKLLNNIEETPWLEIEKVENFQSFTSEPTEIKVKLIPKTTNPSNGVPALYGFYVTEF